MWPSSFLVGVMGWTQEGLKALAVQPGLRVIRVMMQEKVGVLVGPKGKHYPERKAVRHGKENGSVMLGGRKVAVEKVCGKPLKLPRGIIARMREEIEENINL